MEQIDKFEVLMKQSTVASGAAIAGVFAASGAVASTLDTMIITDVNQTATLGGSDVVVDLDLNGVNDFVVYITSNAGGKEEVGLIKSLDDAAKVIGGNNGGGVYQKYGFVDTFEEGDDVPGLTKPRFSDELAFYSQTNSQAVGTGPFGASGATAYIGLVLGVPVFNQIDDVVAINQRASAPQLHYGWLEVERGSLTVLRQGFQSVARLDAPIPSSVPAVPLPATLPLLLAGAGGLAALRRRKSAA